MSLQLNSLQDDLLERGRAAYAAGHRRVIWQAPCAFGKTWCAARQTQRAVALGKRVLHVVHRRRLVDQMQETLGRFGVHSTAIMQGRMRWNADVMCASRDTLLSILDAGGRLPEADLLIPDECHVAADRVLNWYLENHPAMYWCGYTATPVGAGGRSLKPPYQALVCAAPASQLRDIGRLCPVRVYNPEKVGRRRRKGVPAKPVGDPVTHWRQYADGMATVVYAATVAESQAAAAAYNAAGVPAEHLDCTTPEDERERIFGRSERGETLVVCNCSVLVEGVDLPWLRCCQLLRGCNSLVLWAQANGRIMRSFPGKEFGVCLDHAGAAWEYGMPDDDLVWELGSERHNAKLNKPPKERRPITCPKCGQTFRPVPACPGCGHVLPRARRKTMLETMGGDDGLLTLFTERREVAQRDQHGRLFKKLFYMVRAQGGSMVKVAAIFKKQTGKPPWAADLPYNLPGVGEWNQPAKFFELGATDGVRE